MDEIYSKMFFIQLSIWLYNRGQKQYHSFVRHRTLLHQQLKLAGAARGLPGDHGHANRPFFAFQYVLPPARQTSGHEPCRASRNRSHHFQLFCTLSLLVLSTQQMDGFHLAHYIGFRLLGASSQRFPKVMFFISFGGHWALFPVIDFVSYFGGAAADV